MYLVILSDKCPGSNFNLSDDRFSFFNLVIQKRQAKTDGNRAERELLLGLAHDRLYTLCAEYIQRGCITSDEYDNLQYIAVPYLRAGGNGTGKRLVLEVEKLPIRDRD